MTTKSKFSFYSLTSYYPFNIMQRSNTRTRTGQAIKIENKKSFFAMIIFIIGFLLANHYTNSPLLKKCLADTTINNDFCYKKFAG